MYMLSDRFMFTEFVASNGTMVEQYREADTRLPISRKTRDSDLKPLKSHPRETYDALIQRLIEGYDGGD